MTRNMSATDMIRVGFIGASHIAMQVWASIASTGNRVTIVGSRSPAKAQSFIDQCVNTLHLSPEDTPVVGSYEDVVSSDNVDVVYISIPVTERGKWIMSCAAHHKHVVGEKPCARDVNELQTWIHALSQHQLLYMDGTMFSHGNRIKAIVKQVQQSEFAPITHLFANFSISTDDHFMQHDIRVNPALEPHGALGDVGWYCIRAILHLMSFQMPSHVRGQVLQRHPSSNAILAFSGEMVFANKSHDDSNAGKNDFIVGQFFCSFDSACEQVLHIGTTNGLITINDFVMPHSHHDAERKHITNTSWNADCTNHTRCAVTSEKMPYRTTKERDAMWNDVKRIVKNVNAHVPLGAKIHGDDDNDYSDDHQAKMSKADVEAVHYWASLSLKTQEVMDRLLKSALNDSIKV